MYRAQGEGRELSPVVTGGAVEIRVRGGLPLLPAGGLLSQPGHPYSSPSLELGSPALALHTGVS